MASKSDSFAKSFLKRQTGNSKSTQYNTIQLAEVMENVDGAKMGRLRVHLLGSQTPSTDKNTWKTVQWVSPFAGASNPNVLLAGGDAENTYQGTQDAYGMWMIPPDVGNIVAVAFVNGQDAMGLCLGCLYQPGINHMIPGIAKGTTFSDNNDAPIVPVSEVNRRSVEAQNLDVFDDSTTGPKDKVKRATHTPMYNSLTTQGLENDNIRGLTDSSARRESPSKVFGFLTPGGHQFVMDDVSQKYIRLRTIGGAQLLLDDSHSVVYVINSKGTGWVEITESGKIEVFGADSISMRSEKDINIRADRDINIESGRHTNIKANNTLDKKDDEFTQPISTRNLGDIKGNVHIHSAGNFKVIGGSGIDLSTTTFNSFSTLAQKFTTDGESHINAGDFHHETAPKIHMNGPIALKATKVPGISFQADADGNLLYTNILSERTSSSLNSPKVTESKRGSILTRFTTREPYPDHEQSNLENQS